MINQMQLIKMINQMFEIQSNVKLNIRIEWNVKNQMKCDTMDRVQLIELNAKKSNEL